MNKHTPGPWRVVENRVPASLEIYAGETAIVECWRRADVQTEMANAYLIAAAPALYEYVASKSNSGDNEASKLLEMIHGRA